MDRRGSDGGGSARGRKDLQKPANFKERCSVSYSEAYRGCLKHGEMRKQGLESSRAPPGHTPRGGDTCLQDPRFGPPSFASFFNFRILAVFLLELCTTCHTWYQDAWMRNGARVFMYASLHVCFVFICA